MSNLSGQNLTVRIGTIVLARPLQAREQNCRIAQTPILALQGYDHYPEAGPI